MGAAEVIGVITTDTLNSSLAAARSAPANDLLLLMALLLTSVSLLRRLNGPVLEP